MTRTLRTDRVRILGGGLAGCEAAMQLARRGYAVELVEMKPSKRTPAQVTDHLAELVCSNSFRSANVTNAVGALKSEMRTMGSFILECAAVAAVPAGDALAVDREVFATLVEKALMNDARITIVHDEAQALPDDDIATIVATGPLTSAPLAQSIVDACGADRLAFYDAIAPIVEADSIDMSKAYFLSRYGKGEGTDYLNCPMTKEEFTAFREALLTADRVHAKEFEDLKYFEGCLPIEVLAERGEKTLTFGPMKPVGLEHPTTGKRPYAVLQLRKEDVHGSAYNIVGCQTRLKQPDQKSVFALVPGLENARYLRYGAIHRNTYIDAPRVLDAHFRLTTTDGRFANVFFAGQITGVEGYVESTASGLLTSLFVDATLRDRDITVPPATSAMGGLYRHVRGELRADPRRYDPSNVTWAMVPPIENLRRGDDKKKMVAERAARDLSTWWRGQPHPPVADRA